MAERWFDDDGRTWCEWEHRMVLLALVDRVGLKVQHREGGMAIRLVPKETTDVDRMLQFFQYKHLPPHLQMVSKPFCDLAHAIVLGDNTPEAGTVTIGAGLPQNPERTVALRKLLEAKDAAVRSVLEGV